jgi:hypothetical protein
MDGYPLGLVGLMFLVHNSSDPSSKCTTWSRRQTVSGMFQVLGQKVITLEADINDHGLEENSGEDGK